MFHYRGPHCEACLSVTTVKESVLVTRGVSGGQDAIFDPPAPTTATSTDAEARPGSTSGREIQLYRM